MFGQYDGSACSIHCLILLSHPVSKVLYLFVVLSCFQGPQHPSEIPNHTCPYQTLAGLYSKFNRQIHEKTRFPRRSLGVYLVGGFGLKIGYPIGHIQIKTHDHTSTAQNLWSHYTTYKPGTKAMYHGRMATVGCSWWGMAMGRWPEYRNLAVVWDKETKRGGVYWPYHTPS